MASLTPRVFLVTVRRHGEPSVSVGGPHRRRSPTAAPAVPTMTNATPTRVAFGESIRGACPRKDLVMDDPTLSSRAYQRKPIGYTTCRLEAIRCDLPWPPPRPGPGATRREVLVELTRRVERAGTVIVAAQMEVAKAIDRWLDQPVGGPLDRSDER